MDFKGPSLGFVLLGIIQHDDALSPLLPERWPFNLPRLLE